MPEEREENKKTNDEKNEKENVSETWAADAQDDMSDWLEEQGIQLRY